MKRHQSERWTGAVVVPRLPGPVAPLGVQDKGRDELDELIDDVFGEPDANGPGLADAVLLFGGAAALVCALLIDLPAIVLVGSIAALCLGAILPLRSLNARIRLRRHEARISSLIGDGVLLQTDHRAIQDLMAAHDRVVAIQGGLSEPVASRMMAVTHALVEEVATLLGGRRLVDDAEVSYVQARSDSLTRLARLAARPGIGDADTDRRRAVVEARLEVEAIAGDSALDGAAGLMADLAGSDDL